MERALFGSTCSLGGLLADPLWDGAEADLLLPDELDGLAGGRGLPLLPAGAEGGDRVDAGLTGGLAAGEPGGFKADAGSDAPLGPVDSQAWPLRPAAAEVAAAAEPVPPVTANSLALLGQIVTAIQAAQLSSALKAGQPLAPVQPAAPATAPAGQAAQQPGGNTVEGKKVRRMMSNRESARRSRHRKQAHVAELEQRAQQLAAANAALQAQLASAGAELAALRQKVQQLEQGSAAAAPVAESAAKLKAGHSHGSSAGGGVSEVSCCDSLPAKRLAAASEQQPRCKRCRPDA